MRATAYVQIVLHIIEFATVASRADSPLLRLSFVILEGHMRDTAYVQIFLHFSELDTGARLQGRPERHNGQTTLAHPGGGRCQGKTPPATTRTKALPLWGALPTRNRLTTAAPQGASAIREKPAHARAHSGPLLLVTNRRSLQLRHP